MAGRQFTAERDEQPGTAPETYPELPSQRAARTTATIFDVLTGPRPTKILAVNLLETTEQQHGPGNVYGDRDGGIRRSAATAPTE